MAPRGRNISQFSQENYFTFGNAEYFTEKSISVALAVWKNMLYESSPA